MSWLNASLKWFFGKKISDTRIVPVTLKLTFIFAFFILSSNFISNYINLMLNRSILVKQMKQLLIRDLKDLYTFAGSQYEIFSFNKKKEDVLNNIQKRALQEFKNKKSVFLGLKPNGKLLFQSSPSQKNYRFNDNELIEQLIKNQKKNIQEGFVRFNFHEDEYFGVYKFHPRWEVFLIRGEEMDEFYQESSNVFKNISWIIIVITLFCAGVGIYILRYILRFISVITNAILKMIKTQELQQISMKNPPNDDITFLGMAFNSLSTTINTLISIFRKFTNRDIVHKAYKEKEIRLEGSQKELTCLFSDIKNFTTMTETLGTDIINLLNLHYNEAIGQIMKYNGIIGSIIGDALLAVYGALEENYENKSYEAVVSAYEIQKVTGHLREKMLEKKSSILRKIGELSETEKKVFEVIMIEVGVGIDGGKVFYGNIGSHDRMTNTVIGDNVNSASRLEGLTRIYKVPVICSDYVKKDIEDAGIQEISFMELDQVQVKGKTVGKKVFWPILSEEMSPELKEEIINYEKALHLYYKGDWEQANSLFLKSSLIAAEVFRERTASLKAPKEWNGIWTMTSK